MIDYKLQKTDDVATDMKNLYDIVTCLRDPKDGCPWDKEQMPRDIIRSMQGEIYEYVDALNDGDKPHQSEEAQRIAMSQKVEAMDAEEIVEGYAWFMSHGEVDKVPYNSMFKSIASNGELTALGKVYSYMADVSRPEKFSTGQLIPAYLYASSSI